MKHTIWILLVVLAGCAQQKNIYHWGNYENVIYEMYNTPGTSDPSKQLELLTTDIQKANASGKPVPPGLHAHIGMIYAMQGNAAQSQAAFLEEKRLFPESSALIDGMVKRAKGNQKNEDIK